jgi:hypothetical protein
MPYVAYGLPHTHLMRCLLASTTEVEEDVDGGPPRGATDGSDSVRHRVLKTMGLDPILCQTILQNRTWKAVIIPVGLVPQVADLRYA